MWIWNRICLNCSILCFAIQLMRWMDDKIKSNSLIIWALTCATLRCRLGWLVAHAYLEFSAIQFSLIFDDVSPMPPYIDFVRMQPLFLSFLCLRTSKSLSVGVFDKCQSYIHFILKYSWNLLIFMINVTL